MLTIVLKKFGCLLLLLGYMLPAKAGDPEYPVSAIPANLKEKAHAVKRLEEVNMRIYGPDEVRITNHYVITILDANGDAHARYIDGYDKLQEIRSIKGALYDANGKLVRRMKQGDVQDLSAVGENLMTDGRVKVFDFNYKVYPYTVEYEEEVKMNHTFMMPTWDPQEDEELAVMDSKLVVTAPADFKLRYKAYHYNGEPQITTEKDTRTYTWEVKDMPSIPDESYTPDWYTRATIVYLAASSFEVQDYKGSMNTWEELGAFVNTLNHGRDQLPEAVKATVHQLTDGKSQDEKIAVLYKYLQQHTRYISVQLGIGGWQTFDANYVATKGYGDCKALSNYMVSLLKEAGVKACYVLVKAGEGRNTLREDFPSSQFNHAIVCVPGPKDTTWLECTSNTLPPGYLSGFTADRPVLLTDEKGSKLVRTPAYTMDQNLQVRHIAATVSETGDMQVTANTHYTGMQQDDLEQMIHALSHDKQLEKMREGHLMPSYDVTKYECKEKPDRLPAIDEELDISAHNYATVTGKRMFIEPNLLNKSGRRLEANEARIADINIVFPYRDIDSVFITIPEGYTPESMPQPVSVKSNFGEYTSSVTIKDNQITYVRRMDHKAGVFPPSEWASFAAFYNAIYKADRAKMVLVKK